MVEVEEAVGATHELAVPGAEGLALTRWLSLPVQAAHAAPLAEVALARLCKEGGGRGTGVRYD